MVGGKIEQQYKRLMTTQHADTEQHMMKHEVGDQKIIRGHE